ncbi:MAG: helix-turn-helix transcriptional regulator [Clostridia bacterium]|nr:helix-turn-helix transcriptional regulator [Clostridia bacterium]
MPTMFYESREEKSHEFLFAGIICDHPFPTHVHDVVEAVCLQHGTVTMTIGPQQYQLQAGDIAIMFPSMPHSYDQVSEDAQGLTLIFSPGIIREFSAAFRNTIPETPVLQAREAPQELQDVISQLRRLPPEKAQTLQRGYLHLFLSFLLDAMPLRPMDKHVETGLTHQVLHYISQHFTEPLTLENTAHALGISRIHLSHIFSQQLHINFREYINALRISYACELLWEENCSISQIAYQCGYGNPRTFHRAFLSQCGMPPRQYREQNSAFRHGRLQDAPASES